MWKSVCCAVQGAGHKRNGTPCQDKALAVEGNGISVIALADGAGSAALSHYGAQRVVRDVAEYMEEHFQRFLLCEDGRQVKKELVEMLRRGLAEEASMRNCDVRDLASTLLLAAVTEEHYILAHIGDGVVGYLDGEVLKVASTPDNGEFANTTVFVTSTDALPSMRLFKGELKNKDAFVLMSDGTEQSLYDKDHKTLVAVVKRLMHRTCLVSRKVMETQVEDALSTVIARRTPDDCSIALLARYSGSLRPMDSLDFQERRDLYGLAEAERNVRRRVSRCDAILAEGSPCSLKQIARQLHLKPRYAKKYVDRLVSLGLLIQEGGLYRRE